MFPSSERARVPASAERWWISLQVKDSENASSWNVAGHGGAHATSTDLQGSQEEFRCFCWLTRIFPFSLHHLKFHFESKGKINAAVVLVFFCKNVFFLLFLTWCSSRPLIRFPCQQIYFPLTFPAEELWVPSLWAKLISMPGCVLLSFIKNIPLFSLFHWLKI